MDASSCSHGLTEFGEGVLTEENATRHTEIEILDSVVWAERHLLDGLEVSSPVPSVTLHPTCSGRQMGLDWSLERVAGAIADQVAVPAGANCCGFAGDRGMLHPELTASATAEEAAEVGEAPTDRYASTNRTCEIGMQRATGETYESLIGLLEEATRD
jgi:D-lactate dehydrogenase